MQTEEGRQLATLETNEGPILLLRANFLVLCVSDSEAAAGESFKVAR